MKLVISTGHTLHNLKSLRNSTQAEAKNLKPNLHETLGPAVYPLALYQVFHKKIKDKLRHAKK